MMKRILLSVFLICILLIVSVSCTKKEKETGNTDYSNSLSIYIYENLNKEVIEEAIDSFNKCSDVEIIKNIFYKNHRQEYIKKLAIELMSGSGPDIVLIHKNDLQSPQKVMQSNVFFNLNEFVSSGKSLDTSNYNQKVIESGVVNGRRYLIPIGYNVHTFLGNISNIEKNQVHLNISNWSWKGLGEIAINFMQSSTDDNEYFITSSSEAFFNSMILSGNNLFVNYSDKTSNFNTEKFIEILKLYKNRYLRAIVPSEVSSSGMGWVGKQILWDYGWVIFDYNWRAGLFNETHKYYVMPTISQGANAYLEPGLSVGITSKCQNKEEAYDFIKILLSKDIQKKLSYFPINKEALIESTDIVYENIDKGSYTDKDKDKIINHQFEIIERDGLSGYVDYSIIEIVMEELPDFLNGKKSAEQIAQEIDSKVAIYLNE